MSIFNTILKQFFRIILLLGLGGIGPPSYAEQPIIHEYQVKAKYLYSFTKFVAWPDKAFPSQDTRLSLCVLGENFFSRVLDLIVRKHNKRDGVKYILDTRYPKIIEETKGCHVLYISDSEEYYRASILNYVASQPMLTVSDMSNFAIGGGMIQLYRRENKIRFIIDPQTIRDAGLEPHANLLRISEHVSKKR
ncbi:MAG: YfiR family protein [Candidatus Marithrix sp.]|nr:YfiR family protein [Candidatus Marithrix sp.]